MKLGDKYPLIQLIDRAIANRKTEARSYLGASEIGEPCERKLWYGYHEGKTPAEPRVQRIFDFGHMLEDYVLKLLREAGLVVYDRDSEGRQFRFVDHDGRYSGGIDAIVSGLPDSTSLHLVEIKSVNDKRFKELKKGGMKNFESKYWAQAHIYATKFEIPRVLFIAINKNDSELYYERAVTDTMLSQIMSNKALTIIEAKEPLARAYSKSTDFNCKFCEFKTKCWEKK